VESLPADVRRAAARLSTTVDHDHNLPFDESPIEDALIIIRNFSESNPVNHKSTKALRSQRNIDGL